MLIVRLFIVDFDISIVVHKTLEQILRDGFEANLNIKKPIINALITCPEGREYFVKVKQKNNLIKIIR